MLCLCKTNPYLMIQGKILCPVRVLKKLGTPAGCVPKGCALTRKEIWEKEKSTSLWFIFQDVRRSHHNDPELSQNPGIENSLCWLLQLGNTWGKFSGETERENSFSVSKNMASPWLELFSLCSQNGYSQVDHVNSTCGWLQKSTCGTPDLY